MCARLSPAVLSGFRLFPRHGQTAATSGKPVQIGFQIVKPDIFHPRLRSNKAESPLNSAEDLAFSLSRQRLMRGNSPLKLPAGRQSFDQHRNTQTKRRTNPFKKGIAYRFTLSGAAGRARLRRVSGALSTSSFSHSYCCYCPLYCNSSFFILLFYTTVYRLRRFLSSFLFFCFLK